MGPYCVLFLNICDEFDKFWPKLTHPHENRTHLQLYGRHYKYILFKRQKLLLKTVFLVFKILM